MSSRPIVTNARNRHIGFKLLRSTLFLCTALMIVPPMAILGLYVKHANGLPPLPAIETYYDDLKVPSTFYSSEGLLIGEFFEERRVVVQLEQMPIHLLQAFLAAEDERFFEHTGVDARSIIRAAWTNLSAGKVVQGASTITQQLAKTLLGRQKTMTRKVREAILARRMTDVYSKHDILTLYLNLIFLGHNSYGVQAASQNYFRKDVSELSLGESAILSVLPPSPSRINPIRNLAKTLEKRQHVLNRMVDLGYITPGEASLAKSEEVVVYPLQDIYRERMPYIAEEARQRVQKRYAKGSTTAAAQSEWLKNGVKVYTTVDLATQRKVSELLNNELEQLDKKQGYRGPIITIESTLRERFLTRAQDYYLDHGMLSNGALQHNETYMAIVESVGKTTVKVRVTPDIRGVLMLADMRWAGPYKEYPVIGGKRDDKAKVSWRPKLKRCSSAFSAGDVVLVQFTKKGLVLTQTPRVQGAVLSWDPWTGYVRAMVGGSDFDYSQVNRVFSLRQTGSTMKPIYYALAYSLGLRPSYAHSDAPYVRGNFESDGKSTDGGHMLTWWGLTKSRNTVSLRVSEYVENHATKEQLSNFGLALGLTNPLQGNRAEILGGDQTLWDMSHAFGTFLTRGKKPRRTIIRKITDKYGNVVIDRSFAGDPTITTKDVLAGMYRDLFSQSSEAISKGVAFLMRHNLRGVVKQGTATKARSLKPETAGKTGSLPYDVWFNGFSPYSVTTAWIGADNRERILGRSKERSRVYGSGHPLNAFIGVTKVVDSGRTGRELLKPVPSEIEFVTVDAKSGNRKIKGGVSLPHLNFAVPTHVHRGRGSSDDIHHTEAEF